MSRDVLERPGSRPRPGPRAPADARSLSHTAGRCARRHAHHQSRVAVEVANHGTSRERAAPFDPVAPATGQTALVDPYAIGLVPTFEREGANGLMRKLAAIASPDELRRMARAQHVALPPDLRRPEAEPDAIRAAIVAAVEKRITNRRAAAG